MYDIREIRKRFTIQNAYRVLRRLCVLLLYVLRKTENSFKNTGKHVHE
jgi:hypothetical protein